MGFQFFPLRTGGADGFSPPVSYFQSKSKWWSSLATSLPCGWFRLQLKQTGGVHVLWGLTSPIMGSSAVERYPSVRCRRFDSDHPLSEMINTSKNQKVSGEVSEVMSKLLANQIANYNDNGPVEAKEGLNFPTSKPLQVGGVSGNSGQYLKSTGNGVEWEMFPTIPAAQVQVDWTATTGVTSILNKPNLAVVATSGNYNDLFLIDQTFLLHR